jgi:hypothetical protein
VEIDKDFFGSLFDFSFTNFITSKIIKLLYGLSILGAAVLAFVVIIAGFARGTGSGVFALLIFAPLVFLLCVIYTRVGLELIIVLFRIAEHIAQIAEQTRKSP